MPYALVCLRFEPMVDSFVVAWPCLFVNHACLSSLMRLKTHDKSTCGHVGDRCELQKRGELAQSRAEIYAVTLITALYYITSLEKCNTLCVIFGKILNLCCGAAQIERAYI